MSPAYHVHGSDFFFGYLVVLAKLQKPWQNQNKQKNKSLDSRPLSSLSSDHVHGSEHFVCFGFLEVCFLIKTSFLWKCIC